MNLEIIKVDNIDILVKIMKFASELFYNEYKENNLIYYPMGDNWINILNNYEHNKLHYYAVFNNKVVGTLITKKKDNRELTISSLIIEKKYRRRGIGNLLILSLLNDFKKKSIHFINLGSMKGAEQFYLKQGFTPYLLLQVYDFIQIDDILQIVDRLKLVVVDKFQSDFYGFVKIKIDILDYQLIDFFEKSISTLKALYIFEMVV